MDPLDQKDSVDSLAQWDPKVTQAAKEAMENKAQEVFLVRLGMQGNEVPEALGAKLDPRDQSESLVLVAPLVREVLPGHRESRDSLDLLVFLELWA